MAGMGAKPTFTLMPVGVKEKRATDGRDRLVADIYTVPEGVRPGSVDSVEVKRFGSGDIEVKLNVNMQLTPRQVGDIAAILKDLVEKSCQRHIVKQGGNQYHFNSADLAATGRWRVLNGDKASIINPAYGFTIPALLQASSFDVTELGICLVDGRIPVKWKKGQQYNLEFKCCKDGRKVTLGGGSQEVWFKSKVVLNVHLTRGAADDKRTIKEKLGELFDLFHLFFNNGTVIQYANGKVLPIANLIAGSFASVQPATSSTVKDTLLAKGQTSKPGDAPAPAAGSGGGAS